eukprot:304756-Prymnesium_polylepis.1
MSRYVQQLFCHRPLGGTLGQHPHERFGQRLPCRNIDGTACHLGGAANRLRLVREQHPQRLKVLFGRDAMDLPDPLACPSRGAANRL